MTQGDWRKLKKAGNWWLEFKIQSALVDNTLLYLHTGNSADHIWQLIVLFKKIAYYNITILSTPWSIDVGLVVDETLVLDELSTAFPERWVWILTDLEVFLILFARFLLDGPEE